VERGGLFAVVQPLEEERLGRVKKQQQRMWWWWWTLNAEGHWDEVGESVGRVLLLCVVRN
jgi:hypothetical protein